MHFLARLHRDQIAFVAFLSLTAIDREPARIDQHLALGLERFALDARDARGDQRLGGRIEDRQEALDDHVVELLLGFGQVLGRLQRRNDREVVGNLGVVENSLVRQRPVARQNLVRERRIARQDGLVVPFANAFAGQHLERFLDRRQVILR